MPDLFINPLNVEPVSNPLNGQIAQIITGYSDAAINAGQMLYKNFNTGNYDLTMSNNNLTSVSSGMALTSTAGPFQQVSIATSGDVYIGTTSTVGNVIVQGSAAGAVKVGGGSVATGIYPNLVGFIVNTNYVRLVITNNDGTSG